MIALLRRHCFLLAAAILVWQGWAASDASSAAPAPDSGATAPAAPPVLTSEDFAQSVPGAAPLAPDDPFFLRELLLKLSADADASSQGTAPQSSQNEAPDKQSLTPGIRLTLQSTLPSGATGRAWINGHDIEIGDEIPGISAAHPPVLNAVMGSTVTITWSGSDYLLDLYSAAAIELPAVLEDAQ